MNISVVQRVLQFHSNVASWIVMELNGIFTGRNEVVAKVIFLHLFVILFTGGGSARKNPHLPGRTPQDQTPQDQTLSLDQTPPGPDPPPRPDPPREADCSIRSTSGRYASYWNAFLCFLKVCLLKNWLNSIWHKPCGIHSDFWQIWLNCLCCTSF